MKNAIFINKPTIISSVLNSFPPLPLLLNPSSFLSLPLFFFKFELESIPRSKLLHPSLFPLREREREWGRLKKKAKRKSSSRRASWEISARKENASSSRLAGPVPPRVPRFLGPSIIPRNPLYTRFHFPLRDLPASHGVVFCTRDQPRVQPPREETPCFRVVPFSIRHAGVEARLDSNMLAVINSI